MTESKVFYGCTECDHVLTQGEEFCPDHPAATIESLREYDPVEAIMAKVRTWPVEQIRMFADLMETPEIFFGIVEAIRKERGAA
jgi:hypothetical protein